MYRLILCVSIALLVLCQTWAQNAKKKMTSPNAFERYALLKVKYEGLLYPDDSLYVTHFSDELRDEVVAGYIDNTKIHPRVEKGYYYFKVPLRDKFSYFGIVKKRKGYSIANGRKEVLYQKVPLVSNNYIEAGDNILVTIKFEESKNKPESAKGMQFTSDFKVGFYGRGSKKCVIKQYLDSVLKNDISDISTDISAQHFTDAEKKIKMLLDSAKANLNPALYNVLYYDLLFASKQKSLEHRYSFFLVENKRPELRNKFQDFLQKSLAETYRYNAIFEPANYTSLNFISYVYDIIKYLAYMKFNETEGESKRLLQQYKSIVTWSDVFFLNLLSLKDGPLRDRVITFHYKSTNRRDNNNIAIHLDTCLKLMRTEFCKSYLSDLYNIVARGTAYDFTLKNTEGKVIKLSYYKDKVVFIDFWFTGCHACAGYYKNTVSKVHDYFASDTNVVFVTISVDSSVDTWVKSIKSNHFTSSESINLYAGDEFTRKLITRKYDIRAYPFPILIDKTQKIREYNSSSLFTADSLIAKINLLK